MNKKILISLVLITLLMPAAWAQSRETWNINPGWRFTTETTEAQAVSESLNDSNWDLISLPHTMRYFPSDLNRFDEQGRLLGWYRRTLEVPESWEGKQLILHFQGAMQATRLFVNEQEVGSYRVSGYDSFHFDITEFTRTGSNLISVEVDNRDSRELPPDGVKRDFILFGGLYRDVELIVTDPIHITFNWDSKKSGIEVRYPEMSKESATVEVSTEAINKSEEASTVKLVSSLMAPGGREVASVEKSQTIRSGARAIFNQTLPVIKNPELWSPDSPALYTLVSKLSQGGKEIDRVETRIGLRWIEWNKEKGFFLNGEKLNLVGTNRHQTWPFIGNALPNQLHRRDAQQIKDMGMNWIRLSHYPHDPDFLDDLDELGILALEEGPTWMHRIEGAWMKNLETSFRRMIRRDKNRPSIMIWNACINHGDAEEFLVKAGKEEDPTRALGQHDVMAPMDFKHGRISEDNAITIEHTGHMYPVTRGDRNLMKRSRSGRNREFNQAWRHLEMTNLSYQAPGNYGMATWCGYDYNTFHNSDAAIARHGIFDLFRLPKFSYWWHISELTEEPMAYIVRVDKKTVVVYSNAEKVRLYGKSGGEFQLIAEQAPDNGFALNNPPFTFNLPKKYRQLKAEGLFGEEVKTETKWAEPGRAAAIRLTADRETITADGSDISRIIVDILDKDGNLIEADGPAVNVTLEGNGALIGANPVQPYAGRQIILVQAGYQPGELQIFATASGLTSSDCSVKMTQAPGNLLYPADFAAVVPTAPDHFLFQEDGSKRKKQKESVDPFSFTAVTDAEGGVWVESKPMMVGGVSSKVSVKVEGGEYRIYTEPWTDKKGKVQGGDAVTVRIKSSEVSGETVKLTLTIGGESAEFAVTTK